MALLTHQHLEYDTLGGEGAVYPGHPLTLGYLITLAYPSYAAATQRQSGEHCPDALANSLIPGAGGNVYAALDFLKRVYLQDVDSALAWADDYWARCAQGANYGDRHGPGQAQADSLKDALRAQLATWPQAAQTAA